LDGRPRHWGDVFFLHPYLQPFCGVDLKTISWRKLRERWKNCMMGLKPHKAISLCVYKRAFACTGNCCRASNGPPKPSQWNKVTLNLSGDMHYDLSKPCLFRSKDQSEELATLILSYVDDMPATASSEQECWQAMYLIATILNY
jgi:hypothetical protein